MSTLLAPAESNQVAAADVHDRQSWQMVRSVISGFIERLSFALRRMREGKGSDGMLEIQGDRMRLGKKAPKI
jgi:hypothetical protein